MNQRSTYSRSKDSKEGRREKVVRIRRDEDDVEPRRSSPSARFKDASRDTLVFRRQGKFAKSGGEISPDTAPRGGGYRKRPGGDILADEGRLKSFLHRLLRDEDKERQASLMRQVRGLLQQTENHKIIQINKDDIISTFEDFIQLGLNSELKHEFVLTVGALGAVLGSKAKSLLDWEFTVITMSKSEDVRILILKSVLEMLKLDAEKKNLFELVPFIMGKLQSSLEVADNPDLLIAIVNVISEIATGYPSVFSNHFSDTVDILIGWHIDSSQRPSVLRFTSSALVSLRPHWRTEASFTTTLLGQFLEDMESYAEGLPKFQSEKSVMHLKDLARSKLDCSSSTESQPTSSPEENIAKIKSLIRVLITVLRSIGDSVPMEESGPISPSFVLQMLKSFLKHVMITIEYCYCSDLMTSANECVVLLVRACGDCAKEAGDELCAYCTVLQSQSPSSSPLPLLCSLLRVLVGVVGGMGPQLPLPFVRLIFSKGSATHRLRHSPSHKVQRLLIELYHAVLGVKCVGVVEEFYRCLTEEMADSSSLQGAPFLLGVTALVHIGNIKHSLIRMFALKPSYFELMVDHLQPTNPEFAKKYPALQSAILFTLYSHCQRHSHFVDSSSLVVKGGGGGGAFCPPSPSGNHLERVVQLLAQLLQPSASAHDTRLLALRWSAEIVESMQRHLPSLVKDEPFSLLLDATLQAGFSHSNAICKASCKCLHLFLKSSVSALTDATLQKCYDLCVVRLNSHDPDLQEHFSSLLPLLPLHLMLRGPVLSRETWGALRGLMGKPASGNFFGHHFRTVAQFILQGKEPQEKSWLVRVHSSCPLDRGESGSGGVSLAPLWFWGVWEVAQTCVHSKLRTPLGKPQDTFVAIEGALKQAAHPATQDTSMHSESREVTLLRHHLLLSLLEHLEKQMYNAYEGTAAALPTPPKSVRTFFRTNRSTCLEWIGRVRATAVGVALLAGMPATALRHATQLLHEMHQQGNTQGPELEGALFAAVRSLILLGCPEGVTGLYVWCRDTLKRKMPWMKAAVDSAAGRLENSAAEYERILGSMCTGGQEESDTSNDKQKEETHLKSFLINQVVECYAHLQDWKEAVRWAEVLDGLTDKNELPSHLASPHRHTAYLKCLSALESGPLNRKDAVNCGGAVGWPVEEQFGKAQRALITVAAKARNHEHMKDEVNEAKAGVLKLLKISSLDWPLHLDPAQASLLLSATAFLHKGTSPILLQEEVKLDPGDCHSSVLGFLVTWENIWHRFNQGKLQGVSSSVGVLVDLHLVGARLARKQQNAGQCGRMIKGALALLGGKEVLETLEWSPSLQAVRLQREEAKRLAVVGHKDEACDLLVRSITRLANHLHSNQDSQQLAQLNSRSMLNLAKYVQPESGQDSSLLRAMLGEIKTPPLPSPHLEKSVGESEVGELLRLSVLQCPSLAKAWCAFAGWCYSNGRKIINNSSFLSILPEEKARLFELLPEGRKEDLGAAVSIVTNLHNSSNGEWDNQEMEWSQGGEEVRCQLSALGVGEEGVEVWKGVVGRAYSYYRMAAASYLSFLRLDGQDDDNVTSTLRLLRLLVKHASQLRDVLEEGLENTPTHPWRGVVPQLFSRLHHPESYVRCSLSSLLGRVAVDAPHLIVYPAVVGSTPPILRTHAHPTTPHTDGLLGGCFQEEEEEGDTSPPSPEEEELEVEEEEEVEEEGRTHALRALVGGLADQRTIAQARTLVHELHRIALLWDEMWAQALHSTHSEVNRRFLNLEKEIAKVLSNTHLTEEEKKEIVREKHDVYVKPTVFLLEQLQGVSGGEAETPHERWFQKTFGKAIQEAIEGLREPKDPSTPQHSWNLFKKLQHLFERVKPARLTMSEVSPVLSALRSVPMPGLPPPTRIHQTHQPIHTLPTKTRPKKIAFIGTDGKKYTYLFKGLEDLHLDERIMQFLSIVNNMFAKSKRHSVRGVFRARHYSVVPLGARSGLIQWVEGATPLFALYKRWQQREAANAKNASGNVGSVLRPSEIFYSKLTPLLKEKNASNLDNRKEWPLSVLLEVLKQLTEETPDDLLAKELWCSASGGGEWWCIQRTYAHSTAVMSLIGYVIGLGDRHLDNVLVDMATGEVVHIDYNVCFEKGKNLRVPEKVPFRMTPNIKRALGLTGIEGVFRGCCEHALRVLRRGRETLLTLLEAFVYDPLVEWANPTNGGGIMYGGGGKRRREMEEEIARSMLRIRVREMRTPWNTNREEVLGALSSLEVVLGELSRSQLLLAGAEGELEVACQQKALMEEALHNPHHSLHTLHNRYGEASVVKKTVNAAKEAVKEKLAECQKWHVLHCDALSAVCGPELGRMATAVTGEGNEEDSLAVAPAVEFLQSAGQGQLVQQCEQAEGELSVALQQRRASARSCVELLTTYATIIMQFGPTYNELNRCFKWQQWLEGLLEDFSSLKCVDVLSQLGREQCSSSDPSLHLQLQASLSDANARLLAAMERMRLEGVDDKFAKEADLAVQQYVTECGDPSHLALMCVVREVLSTHRKQLQLMEEAARASGEHLLELTSWNGVEWFLDEISGVCGSAAHCVHLLMDSPLVLGDELKQSLVAVKSMHFVLTSLEDLCSHFQDIIVPELLRSALDPCVREMASRLQRVIARSGTSLDNLLLHCPQEEGEDGRLDAVRKLRNEFESLMQTPTTAGMNQGQMLLMGLNGLFTKVDSDLDSLLLLLSAQHTTDMLRDVFFVRKLQVVQQAFLPCPPIESKLVDAVRHYAAEYVRHMVLGLPSLCVGLSLRHLARESGGGEVDCDVDAVALVGALECAHVPPLTALVAHAQGAWHKEDARRRADTRVLVLRGAVQRAQLQLARFQWMNEDSLPTPSSRAQLMQEIRKSVSVVVSLECGVSSALERFLSLGASVEQRLKWAAGANPSLAQTQLELEDSIQRTTQQCSLANQVCNELISVCNSILHFEALRTRTTEAVSSEAQLLALMHRCEEACELSESCQSRISSTEERLIALKPLQEGEGVSVEWLGCVMHSVSRQLASCRERLEQQRNELATRKESVRACVSRLHDLISAHHKLMSEVRHILRNMEKHEEGEGGPVSVFTSSYRSFSEQLSSLVSSLQKDCCCPLVDDTLLPTLTRAAEGAYSGLIALGEADKKVADSKGAPKKDPKASKAGVRNAFATTIWKRIKMKLDGRDPDPNKKATVQEQVEWVIREATLPENLAVLYEGWTPWV